MAEKDPEVKSQETPSECKPLLSNFGKDLLRRVHSLRCHKKLCDVVLRAGGQEIHTHRAILAACSSYFLAMFTHELREREQEVVDIKDMNPEILSSLVDFAYTGEIDITVENVQEVLSASSLLQIVLSKTSAATFSRSSWMLQTV